MPKFHRRGTERFRPNPPKSSTSSGITPFSGVAVAVTLSGAVTLMRIGVALAVLWFESVTVRVAWNTPTEA